MALLVQFLFIRIKLISKFNLLNQPVVQHASEIIKYYDRNNKKLRIVIYLLRELCVKMHTISERKLYESISNLNLQYCRFSYVLLGYQYFILPQR